MPYFQTDIKCIHVRAVIGLVLYFNIQEPQSQLSTPLVFLMYYFQMLQELHLRRPIRPGQRQEGVQDDVQEAPLQRQALPPHPGVRARHHGRAAQGTCAHRPTVLQEGS